jgi:exopolyphosphatase/pppGpp-phosphohydrolase
MARERSSKRIGAAIDIGSYSVHLLVGEIQGSRVVALHDESAFLALGRTIDAHGALGLAGAQLVDTLASFSARARELGASTVTVVGTDPLRRAADAVKVLADIREATGVEAAVLSHEEEAMVASSASRPGVRSIARP